MRFLFGFLFLLMAGFSMAQGPVAPRKSPVTIAKVNAGTTYIKVVYSQPHKNERAIFGELVPFEKVWRLGANEATELHVTKPITMGGKKIPSGTYSLFAIPHSNSWTIIVSKQLGLWGSFDYDSEQDLCRFDVKTQKTDVEWEPFTIKIDPDGKNYTLSMMWDMSQVRIPIKAK